MSPQLIAQLMFAALILLGVGGLYIGTMRPWHVRFDRGQGYYDNEPYLIMAHTQEGAKRKAKRLLKKNKWRAFKLRAH